MNTCNTIKRISNERMQSAITTLELLRNSKVKPIIEVLQRQQDITFVDLARLTGSFPTFLNTVLNDLKSSSIVTSSGTSNQTLYSLNKGRISQINRTAQKLSRLWQ